MRQQQGMILLTTVIISGVIAWLVMANMRSLQSAFKVSNTLQQKQYHYYELQKQFKDFLTSKPWQNTSCILQTTPEFSYPFFSGSPLVCVWDDNRYVIYDGGKICYLLKDKKQAAHIFHILFANTDEHYPSKIQATYVLAKLTQSCQSQTSNNLNDGIISLQVY